MLRIALKRSAVPYNYSAASKERVDNPNAKRSRALTVAEARLVWELIIAERDKTRHGPKTHTAHDTLAAVLALQVGGGGLRIGEAAALNVANIDWESGTVRINATVIYREPEGTASAGGYKTPGAYIIQGHTKRREVRDVIVDDWALDLLKDLAGKASADGLLFHSKGRVPNLNNLRRTLRGALRGSSVAWATPHSYRHTVATAVSRDEEFGIEGAARVLGHSSSNTTKGYV
jgi:integrase